LVIFWESIKIILCQKVFKGHLNPILDMEAKILQFRRGRTTQKTNQMIIRIEGVDSKAEASKFVKKLVEWKAPGKKQKVIRGAVKNTHGNSGAIRVLFERGMPGQAIGTKVLIK